MTEVITVSNIIYPLAAVKVIVTVGRTLLTEVITISNILYPLAAVTSYNNSRQNFIDRGYHS